MTVVRHEFELLVDGVKLFDVRSKKGGGGAVDLVVPFRGLNFNASKYFLRQLKL